MLIMVKKAIHKQKQPQKPFVLFEYITLPDYKKVAYLAK